ncbi:MAG: hypothetical protein HGA27_01860 [Peptococcaceae bacterium]|nr:hypothetical protein [Peptococcaceae bacterium]
MVKSFNNNKGVALLTVMLIMGAVMIIMNIIIYAVTQEKLAANRYNDSKEAFYVAEAAADYASAKWNYYITQVVREGNPELPAPDVLNGINNHYFSVLNSSKGELLDALKRDLGTSDIKIEYSYDNSNTLYNVHSEPENTPRILVINIEAEYNGIIYPYKIFLDYCNHGKATSRKGNITN